MESLKLSGLILASILLFTSLAASAGCNDPLACNFVSTDTDVLDCIFPGCLDTTACNYDSIAICSDTCLFNDACGVCGGAGNVAGCTDTTACNYDSLADCDNSSCLFADACGICGGAGIVAGCTDTTACNYDSLADCDDSSCLFADACGICGGAGIVAGCIDTTACNYNSLADCDDASCLFGDSGCTDLTNCLYDPAAVCDDGSCGLSGCTDSTSINYDSTAVCDDGSCLVVPPGEFPLLITLWQEGGSAWGNAELTIEDDNGTVYITETLADGDLKEVYYSLPPNCYQLRVNGTSSFPAALYLVHVFDGVAEERETFGLGNSWQSFSVGGSKGCTDPIALNYESLATCDDGSCFYCEDDLFCAAGTPTPENNFNFVGDGLVSVWGFGAKATSTRVVDGSGGVNMAIKWQAETYHFVKLTNSTGSAASDMHATFIGGGEIIRAYLVNNSASCSTPQILTHGNDASTLHLEWDTDCVQPNDFVTIKIITTDPVFQFQDGYWSDLANQAEPGIGIIPTQEIEMISGPEAMGAPGGGAKKICWALKGDGTLTRILEFGDITAGPGVQKCYCDKYDSGGGLISRTEYVWDLDKGGCTDTMAVNYDSTALYDDGSCVYEGCTTATACNYDLYAPVAEDDGSCIYPGCTTPLACNYISTAGCDDGSCEFDTCQGCTYPDAPEYDPLATIDDGSCTCGSSCPNDLDANGIIDTPDLLVFLTSFGTMCP